MVARTLVNRRANISHKSTNCARALCAPGRICAHIHMESRTHAHFMRKVTLITSKSAHGWRDTRARALIFSPHFCYCQFFRLFCRALPPIHTFNCHISRNFACARPLLSSTLKSHKSPLPSHFSTHESSPPFFSPSS